MEATDARAIESVQSEVRAFIVENFLFGTEQEFCSHDSLLQNGLVDSTGILELVQFIEQTYDLQISDDEMVPENLDSLHNVATFVVSKGVAR